MGRRSRHVVGVLSLTMVLLVVATAAMAAQITPKDGRYATYSKGQQGSGAQYFNVTGAGRKVTFEINLEVLCETPDGLFHTTTTLTSAVLKPSGKASPLAIKNGKFSFNGPIYGGPATKGEGQISGTFKSATKLVASAQFSWPAVTVLPGVEGSCKAPKVTVSGSPE